MKLAKRFRTGGFLLIAFGFSYGAGMGSQWLIAVQGWAGANSLIEGLPGFLIVLGPALAAALVTRWSGESVVHWLVADWRSTRLAWWWLAIPPATLVITMASFHLAGAADTPVRDAVSNLSALAGYYTFHIVLVGLPEEIGWRGWLLREQLARTTPLSATLIVALAWGLWHFPKLVTGLPFAAAFAAAVFVNSFLLTALWSRFEGRTALAALAHGSFNAPIYFFAAEAEELHAVRGFAFTVAAYAALAVVVILFTRTWWTTAGPPLCFLGPSARAPSQ